MKEIFEASDNIGINTVFPEDVLEWLSELSEDMEKATIISWDSVLVRYWSVTDDLKIAIYKQRPGRFHRLMMRWLLGWRWEDA